MSVPLPRNTNLTLKVHINIETNTDIVYTNDKTKVIILITKDNKYLLKLKKMTTIENEIKMYNYISKNNIHDISPVCVGIMQNIKYKDVIYDHLLILKNDPRYIPLDIYLKQTKLNIMQKFQITQTLLHKLYKIHNNGIVHRDIKPSNIIINSNTLDILFIDFDLSVLEFQNANNYTISGTRNYIDPKLTSKKRSYIDIEDLKNGDIWSLCITIYYIYIQQYPFSSKGKYRRFNVSNDRIAMIYDIPGKVLYDNYRYTLNELIQYVHDINNIFRYHQEDKTRVSNKS
jgi:serine/threonine protein kinase